MRWMKYKQAMGLELEVVRPIRMALDACLASRKTAEWLGYLALARLHSLPLLAIFWFFDESIALYLTVSQSSPMSLRLLVLLDESTHVRDVMHNDDRYKLAKSNSVLNPIVLYFIRTNKTRDSDNFNCLIASLTWLGAQPCCEGLVSLGCF